MEKWGKKKQIILLTLQGNLTEKQFEKIQNTLLKIAVRYKLGYGASDELGYDFTGCGLM